MPTGRSRSGNNKISGTNECSILRLELTSTGAVGWTPYDLGEDICRVKSNGGVAVSPWDESVVVWDDGFTSEKRSGAEVFYGGACRLPLDFPSNPGSEEMLIDPAKNAYQIISMVPDPDLVDRWYVAPRVTVETEPFCIQDLDPVDGDGWIWDWARTREACKDPLPAVLDKVEGSWDLEDLDVTGLPSFQATVISLVEVRAGFLPSRDPAHIELLYGIGGSGVFRGVLPKYEEPLRFPEPPFWNQPGGNQ